MAKLTTYKIKILNWEKHNPKVKMKSGHTHFMFSKRFFNDQKIINLRAMDVLLFVNLLSIAADSMSDHVVITSRSLLNAMRLSGQSLADALMRLEEIQLLTYEKVVPNRIELNRIEYKGKELRPISEKIQNPVKQVDPPPLPELAVLWNENCGSLPKAQKTNNARNHKAKLRFSEDTVDSWIEVIKKIASSDFCLGKNERGWTATFDWLIQPETRLKVLEGKYENKIGFNKNYKAPAGNLQRTENADEEYKKMMEELNGNL